MQVDSEVSKLKEQLDKLDKDEAWVYSLPKRKRQEATHGDYWRSADILGDTSREAIEKKRSSEKKRSNVRWYEAAIASQTYVKQWLENESKARLFLDYACGVGGKTIDAAKAGAKLAIGIDISPVSVERAKQNAKLQGVEENTSFFVGDCENTGLPANSIDVILCSEMLHHIDLSYALPEMRRILKPGGKVLAVEAFKYNPLIQIYRLLTPAYRTKWEVKHIIGYAEIYFMKRFFLVKNIQFWHFFDLLAIPFRRTVLFKPLLSVSNVLDRIFLNVFPFSLLAWQVTFEFVKHSDEK